MTYRQENTPVSPFTREIPFSLFPNYEDFSLQYFDNIYHLGIYPWTEKLKMIEDHGVADTAAYFTQVEEEIKTQLVQSKGQILVLPTHSGKSRMERISSIYVYWILVSAKNGILSLEFQRLKTLTLGTIRQTSVRTPC